MFFSRSGSQGRTIGQWLLLVLLALVAPVGLQAQTWISVEPHIGGAYNFTQDVEANNRWGISAGVTAAMPSTNYFYPQATFGYVRTGDAYRTTFPNGGCVYAAAMVPATVGVGHATNLNRHARVALGIEVGVGGEREVETEQIGEPRPGQARGNRQFSFGAAGLISVGVQQSLARRLAAAATLRTVVGPSGALPTLALGLVLR